MYQFSTKTLNEWNIKKRKTQLNITQKQNSIYYL